MGRHAVSRWAWLAWTLLAGTCVAAEPNEIWATDLDDLRERRVVRILVAYGKTFYFVDSGQPHGISYELGAALEKDLNRNNPDRARPVRVMFIPVRRDRMLPSLIEGRGDIAAVNLTITPERLELVDFSAPFAEGVSEIFVTSNKGGAPLSVYDLSGRSVFVRRSSSYFASLEELNRVLRAKGKPPAKIVLADENLEDEDILEMLNADLIDATVVDSYVASFWSQLLPNIRAHPQAAVRGAAQIAWAIRKDSPLLKAELATFVRNNRVGTTTGNILLRRYLRDTRWAKNATAESDMRRFSELSKYFQKYATQYRFEWLMLVAQGYQESGLDQNARSPVGAIGVMQVMPTTAGDRAVNIPDIHLVDQNIHAGVKYLRYLVDQFFNEPGIDLLNRHLFAFAAYNAGPTRIAKLRREAAAAGLDPNTWFYNVELIAAREIGRETVQYVSNVFKYYIAYKLVVERARERAAIKRQAG
ncbi:MAG TPA: transporter substrate-binding domain-containing protein [Steroidobacteraceae bacterium]